MMMTCSICENSPPKNTSQQWPLIPKIELADPRVCPELNLRQTVRNCPKGIIATSLWFALTVDIQNWFSSSLCSPRPLTAAALRLIRLAVSASQGSSIENLLMLFFSARDTLPRQVDNTKTEPPLGYQCTVQVIPGRTDCLQQIMRAALCNSVTWRETQKARPQLVQRRKKSSWEPSLWSSSLIIALITLAYFQRNQFK